MFREEVFLSDDNKLFSFEASQAKEAFGPSRLVQFLESILYPIIQKTSALPAVPL